MRRIILAICLLINLMNAEAQWEKCDTITGVRGLVRSKTSGLIFVSTSSNGVLASSDSGKTWVQKNNGLKSNKTGAIAAIGNNLVVSNDDGGIYYSVNDGENWIKSSNNKPVDKFAVGNNTIYGGYYDLYYSNDYGVTWENIPTPYGDLLTLFATDSILFAGFIYVPNNIGYYNIYRSIDYGTTFSFVPNIWADEIVMVDSTLFGINEFYFYKSTDFGLTWQLDTTLNYEPGFYGSGLYTDGSKFILAGTPDSNIYISKNKGRSWENITDNFQGIASDFLNIGNIVFVSSVSYLWKRNIDGLTGIDPVIIDRHILSIKPNPTAGIFHIAIPTGLSNIRNFVFRIFNIQGHQVQPLYVTNEIFDLEISISNLPNGLYFIELFSTDKWFSAKILKE